MPWFYNSFDGALREESGVAAAAYVTASAIGTVTGWHEYSTRAAALAAITKNGWKQPSAAATDTGPGGILPAAEGGAAAAVGAATSAASSGVTGFLSRLADKSTWTRVAETIIGIALIIVGLAKFASGTSVGRTAESIGTKAALL